MGFTPVAYSGLETGNRSSAVIRARIGSDPYRGIRTLPANQRNGCPSNAARGWCQAGRIGCRGCGESLCRNRKTSAVTARAPREEIDEFGELRTAAIYTYGEVLHVFVDRSAYGGPFGPTYKPLHLKAESAGLAAIDHIVGNVQLGKMDHWVRFYHQVMGFRQLIHFDDQDISTEYSALMSKVMQNGNGRIKLPINEPAEGKKKSQIEEFLDYYLTPGVQHIAMSTGDILKTVGA